MNYAEINARAMKDEECKYTYTQSTQIMAQTGCIGHLRADFGRSGEEFFSLWEDHRGDLKTKEFKEELDLIFRILRYDGFLMSRKEMRNFCASRPVGTGFGGAEDTWGVRIDTEKFSYLMRMNPSKGQYNLYCYCYVRDWLNQHMEKARGGVRFISSSYEEKFRVPDGDKIRVIGISGNRGDHVARYIDDYHVEIGGNLYHICQYAELMERNGSTVIPLRSSLPNECYVFVRSDGVIGVVKKGESGYYPASITLDDNMTAEDTVEHLNDSIGVSKAQAAAMMVGSLFGWACPAADPANYDENGNLVKKGGRG